MCWLGESTSKISPVVSPCWRLAALKTNSNVRALDSPTHAL